MPEHLADLGQRRSGAQHLGRQRVAEPVRAASLEPGMAAGPAHDLADRGRRQLPVRPAGTGQDELFPVWRHHVVFTDSPFELIQAERQHRDQAVVEQVFADVTSGPLAHMPSGVFAANAAWLSIVAMAHNLLRAADALASLPFAKAQAAAIRRDLIAVAARTAQHGRGHLTLHLPEGLHQGHEWQNLFAAACGPPPRPDQAPIGPHPPWPRRPPEPRPRASNPDEPQNRPAAGSPCPDSLRETPGAGNRPKRSTVIGPVDQG